MGEVLGLIEEIKTEAEEIKRIVYWTAAITGLTISIFILVWGFQEFLRQLHLFPIKTGPLPISYSTFIAVIVLCLVLLFNIDNDISIIVCGLAIGMVGLAGTIVASNYRWLLPFIFIVVIIISHMVHRFHKTSYFTPVLVLAGIETVAILGIILLIAKRIS